MGQREARVEAAISAILECLLVFSVNVSKPLREPPLSMDSSASWDSECHITRKVSPRTEIHWLTFGVLVF